MHDSAHLDSFARERLPAPALQPRFLFERPELRFAPRLNCATELLDRWVERGQGARPCLQGAGIAWSYAQLQQQANRIARVLVHDMGLVPGNRVLLRGWNEPMLAACWYAVMKAGGIAVTTMPLLRAKELGQIVAKAQVSHALCDAGLAEELRLAAAGQPVLRQLRCFHDEGPEALEAALQGHPGQFDNVDTAADDICLLAFTSGTTGVPKATMHFHRDVMAVCACWPRHVLRPTEDDVFIGSPPLAFTFGLGGLLLFPMDIGASSVLLPRPAPLQLLDAVTRYRASVLFTAPTCYRTMAAEAARRRLGAPQGGSLRLCVSAGEALPASTRALWKEATGLDLIDGIGATEMLHIFISADAAHARAGATGTVVPGYCACVMDEQGRPLPPGVVGRLAVQGPTGCRYLDDEERQRQYVKDGWNYTGDAYLVDTEGYYHWQARTDDLIVSAGYNIGAPEVEEALSAHAAVADCAVIGVPDAQRGQLVKAFVVLQEGWAPSPQLVTQLQNFVKAAIAPYKYPRAIEFRTSLPRTETGKLQRYKLRAAAS